MDNYSNHLTTVLSYDRSMDRILSLGEEAFESDCDGLMKGFLKKVTVCISQNNLGYAVGTNKTKSRVFSQTTYPKWVGRKPQ